ncbi:MAG: prenyltransferase [Acidimicrobiales bacterium]
MTRPTAGPGVDLATTVDFIAATQQADGMIPWFPGGHGDPWNHVEAAMALDVGGRPAEAAGAYQWLATNQRPDGAWHQYYRDRRVCEPTLDANVTAYVATGAWHHFLCTGDIGFLEEMLPVVTRAMDFVLGLQAPGGEVIWARHADGTPWSFALLTASSSTCHSLRSASAIAAHLGLERPEWKSAADSVAWAVANRPEAFLPKDRWSMDWYYPVLTGIVRDDSGRRRLAEGRDRFVMDGLGVRCVADKDWVTAAETCECAIAHVAVGDVADAVDLFAAAQHLRADDGTYFTGMVHPERVHFPAGERTTYSAAAVVLAADTIWGTGPASRVFAPVAGQPSYR